ncbi:PilW family protein [Saccharospirillum sp. MSK14-1]|uniref:PilW family protein n=1 Tax=Saccharospirillum sp. MSK14-1 TaxID=1897632 RepID=UPI00130499AA|nr:PilW family protein [Saccharospirillum sp. MSK14-1]
MHPRSKQHGFSLIELLIALTLSLVVIGGAIQILLSGQRSYQLLLQQARLQENARMALSYLAADIRQAGFVGCDLQSIPIANLVGNRTESWLYGWDDVDDFGKGIVDGTDVLAVRRFQFDHSRKLISQSSNTVSTLLTTTSGIEFDNEPIVALVDSDCSNMAIFQVTDSTNSSVEVEAGGANCSHILRGNFDCDQLANADPSRRYSPDAQLFAIEHIGYAIHPPSSKSLTEGTSLWRLNFNGSNQEIIEGVDDLQLRYGLDTSNPVDGVIDRYFNAAQINAANHLSFDQLVAVEITLTMRAESQSIGGEDLTLSLTAQVRLANGVL